METVLAGVSEDVPEPELSACQFEWVRPQAGHS
jgi:hypothetical protein